MAEDKFVPDAVDMLSADASKIRKLLGIHPRRDIPAKVLKVYSSMYHMLSHNRGGFTRETLAVVCAIGCKVRRGRISNQVVLLVDGQDLSEDPQVVAKREAEEAEKAAAIVAKRAATTAANKAAKKEAVKEPVEA